MPEIANKGFYPAGTVNIGTDGYKAAIDSCTLTPTTPMTAINDIGGGVTHILGTPVWVLGLSLVQDVETTNSLTQYLIANAGTEKTAVYTPKAGGKGFTVKVMIMPGAIGGAGGQVAKAQVNLPVNGQPVIA